MSTFYEEDEQSRLDGIFSAVEFQPFESFTKEFQLLLKDDTLRRKLVHQVDDEIKIYNLNSQNAVANQPVPVFVDDFDLLEQVYRFIGKEEPPAKLLQSAHYFAMWVRTIKTFAELSKMFQWVRKFPRIELQNMRDVDGKLFLSSLDDEKAGISYPHAQGLSIRDWHIISNADGSNLFYFRHGIKLDSRDILGLKFRPDFIFDLQFELMGVPSHITPEMVSIRAFSDQLTSRSFSFQKTASGTFVCQIDGVFCCAEPTLTNFTFHFGILQGPGEIPPALFLLFRHSRVILHTKVSKEFKYLCSQLKIRKTSDSRDLYFKKKAGDHIITRPRHSYIKPIEFL